MMMASKSYKKHPAHKELYDALIQSLFVDEYDMDKVAATIDPSTQLKRNHDDQDEDPTARSDQGKEKKRPRKDTQPSKKSSVSSESSKVKTLPKTSKYGKSVTAKEPHEKHVHEISMDAEENIVDEMSNADEQPYGEDAPKIDNGLKNNWFKQPPRPPTPDPEWNKCLIVDDQPEQTCRPGHLTVPAEHFFNNDLEYLKSKNLENKYTMSITKTKAARYELVGFEDMISNKWSVVKVGYNKDDERRISHWGPKHQLFYKSQSNKLSKHNVYSTLKIMSVVSMTVDKQFGYGYLEEIVVRRADRQLYTFKEGDFINLDLNDIEDVLLLVVQHKLFHLDGDAIVDLAVALRIFTRRIVIKKRVEDVQLGVESYQKKLNINRPQMDFPTISTKEPYTS
ncbi:hypothetical protein Tco_1201029 [Tanacetum coccineum]